MYQPIGLCLLLLFFSVPTFAQESVSSNADTNLPTLIKAGAYDSAMVLVDQMLNEDSLATNARLWKFQLLRNLRQHQEAEIWGLHNYELFGGETAPDKKWQWLLSAAEAAINSRKSEKAQSLLAQANVLWKHQPPASNELQSYFYYCQGRGLWHFGDIDTRVAQAASLFLKALPPNPETTAGDPYVWSQTLRYLGIIYMHNADYEQSINYFQKSLEVVQAFFPSDHFDVGVAHYNLANTYYHSLEYEKALAHYLPTYDIWKNHYEPQERYMRYLTEAIGDMYWELEQKEKALPYYNLSVVGKEGKGKNDQLDRPQLADSLLSADQYEAAMRNYDQALAFRKEIYGDKHPMTGACQNQIARAHRLKGHFTDALDAYQQAMIMLVQDFQDSLPQANPSLEMKIISEQNLLESLCGKFFTLDLIYQKSGSKADLALALATAQQAIDLLHKLRQSALSDEALVFWGQKYYSIFGRALDLAFQHYPQSDTFVAFALPIIESSKTIVLQKALYLDQNLSQFDLPEKLLQEERALQKSIHEYQARIENEERHCERAQVKKIELWQSKLLDQKLTHYALLDQIKEEHPQYHALKYGREAVDLSELRQQLLSDSEKAIILYFEAENYFYAIAITKEQVFHHRSPNGPELQKELNRLLRSFYDINAVLQEPQQSFRDFSQLAHRWHQRLVAPLQKQWPTSIQQLYIIPDHHLYYLPFDALLTQAVDTTVKDYRELPYLLRDYQVSYSQSAAVLRYSCELKEKKKYTHHYTGFAPENFTETVKLLPLQWNQKEVKQVAQQWNGQSLTGTQAVKTAFEKSSRHSQILHLATHAQIDDTAPMMSSIFFENQQESNGILHAYELYANPIESELVVLSACNTSQGKWKRGEGMIGLERAFQYAGCPALLTNTWAIDDEASASLNQYFFESLKTGLQKAAALRQAKERYLQTADPAHRHPFFWSGLRLTGNPYPITIQGFSYKNVLLGISLLLFLGIGFLLRKKNQRFS